MQIHNFLKNVVHENKEKGTKLLLSLGTKPFLKFLTIRIPEETDIIKLLIIMRNKGLRYQFYNFSRFSLKEVSKTEFPELVTADIKKPLL